MKPTTYYSWAQDDDEQYVDENGISGTVPNKSPPEIEFTQRGIYYLEGMPIQYWNYQLNGYGQWFQHLDERLDIGDLYPTTENLAEPDIEERLGGSWTLQGTTTISSTTTYWWKKTA